MADSDYYDTAGTLDLSGPGATQALVDTVDESDVEGCRDVQRAVIEPDRAASIGSQSCE